MARHDIEPYDEFDDEDDSDIEDGVLEEIAAQYGDDAKNAEAAREAQVIVTSYFESEGWMVSAPDAAIGTWDLLCTREGEELHVKVKGTASDQLRFILTDQEVETASEDDNYLVCAVTGAGTDEAELTVIDPEELLEDFRYRPTHWAFQQREEDDEE